MSVPALISLLEKRRRNFKSNKDLTEIPTCDHADYLSDFSESFSSQS